MNEMTSDDWRRVGEWFDELSELPEPDRDRRLDALQLESPALATRLRAMLSADSTLDGVLERSLDELAPALCDRLDGNDWETQPGQRLGRYRLVEPIGSGGMGEVWCAERADGEYRQQVALKLLKRGMDTQAILRRFLQERSILARLVHPNIVRLLDGGMSDDGRPYYVMERVVGESLTHYAIAHGLDLRARVRLIADVADTVAYAHAQLIVHRDLKPSNVIVDANGVPHLLDFGIAKLLEDSGEQTLTGTGVRVLSPAYAAPEQILGEPVGTAADIYALGTLLFELLTGTLPHRRTSRDPERLADELDATTHQRMSHVLMRHDAGAAVWPEGERARIARAVGGDLELIAATALRRDPWRRYPTAAAMADDLRRWLDHQPIMARPESAAYRLRKFVRRHTLAVIAGTGIVLALVVGLGLALWQAGIAHEQAQRAERQAARTERVKAFLIDLFRQNDPVNSHGETLTGRQMLERSQAALASQLADDPDTRGELLVSIAEIEHALADFDRALKTINQGLALLRRSAAVDDTRLAQGLHIRARIYAMLDRPGEADRDLREALTILSANPVANADRIDAVQQELAMVMRYTASPDEALELQRAVVQRSSERLGPDSSTAAERRIALGLMLEEAGNYVEAEAAYRSGLSIIEARRGQLDPWVCNTQASFAGLLDRIGKREEAKTYFDRALAGQAQLFGMDSVHYGRTLFSRGIMMLSLRQYAAAESDFRDALKAVGEESYTAAHAHRYLGQALLSQDRLTEAAEQFRQAEEAYRRLDLPNDAQQWRARADYGYARFKLGFPDEGRTSIESALSGMRKVVGEEDVMLMRPLMMLGQIERQQENHDAAIRYHERWREIALEKLGPEANEAMASGHELALDLLARRASGDLERAGELIAACVAMAQEKNVPMLAEYERTRHSIIEALSRQ